MAAGSVILALVAFALLAVLVRAVRQNVALWRQVRAAGRPVGQLLRDTLVLWSPLALVIVLAVLAARWAASSAVALTYRLTTIDAFCRVVGVDGDVVVPCTGLDHHLSRAAVRRAGIAADVDELVSARFRAARQRLLGLDAPALRTALADRARFHESLRSSHVLGLPRSPLDDPELAQLRAELRRVLAAEPPPPRDALDLLRLSAARNARTLRLRELTAQARARRELVAGQAYAGKPRAEQGRLYLQHRVAQAVDAIPASTPDVATMQALARLAAGTGDEAAELERAHRGLATLLARNEAATAAVLARQAREATGPGALKVALSPPPRCTLARPDPDLRRSTADFAGGATRLADAALATNAGTFACFAFPPGVETLGLEPLGFRASVRRSIDRWHARQLADGMRRLGMLAGGTATSRDATRELAEAIPRGIDLGRSRCGLLHPAGCVANAMREAAEETLADAFAEVAEPAERSAAALADTAADIDTRVGQAIATFDARLARLRAAAHAQAGRLFLAGDLLRLLGWLMLAFVVLKSFLYVLALEIFHHGGELTFGLEATTSIEGEVRAGRQLTIDRGFARPLITRQQLSNTDNALRLAPWPLSAPIARLLRGRYLLYTRGTFLADAERPARGMVASASGGMSIVEWKMQPGEEVVFAYRDFFGASDNIRLRTEFSLRLSTLLLGRLLFRIARCEEGEGRLLLRAHVEEIDPEHIRAIPPERLLAWHRHARFAIHSGRTAWSTLVNGYTLVRKAGIDGADGQVVVSSEDAGSNLGSIRFVRRIFSALF